MSVAIMLMVGVPLAILLIAAPIVAEKLDHASEEAARKAGYGPG